MLKGTSQAEATSNSEKIKPIILAIDELHLTEGISQAVSQSVSQSVSQKKIPLNKIIYKIPWQLFGDISGRYESLFGLSFT